MQEAKAKVNREMCLKCGGCVTICPQDAIVMSYGGANVIADKCSSCGLCIRFCSVGAIDNGI